MKLFIITLLTTVTITASQELQKLQELEEYKHKQPHISFEIAWEKRVQFVKEKSQKNICPKCAKPKNNMACILLH